MDYLNNMTIREWLSSIRNYDTGRLLYEKHGNNVTLKRTFNRGISDYNKEKLVYELEKLVGVDEVDVPKVIVAPEFQHVKVVFKNEPVDISTLPADLLEKHVRKGKLFQEASYTHAQLHHLKTDEERLEYAKKIVLNFKEIDSIWAELDYFKEHGKPFYIPVPEEFKNVKDTGLLYKKRNNLRSLVSKVKKKIQIPKPKQKHIDQLQKLEMELKEIERMLES